MFIQYPDSYFLGANLLNPKVYYKKIKELIDAINGVTGTSTQLTSITTTVTLNATKGVITTVPLTTSSGSTSGPFTFLNSYIKSTSIIMATLEYDSTKTGAPYVIVDDVTNGKIKFKIANGGTAVLNDIVKIHFAIL